VYTDAEVVRRHPHARQFLEIFQLARPRPVTPYYSRLSDVMQIQIHRAISREIDAQTALRNAAEQIHDIPGFRERP